MDTVTHALIPVICVGLALSSAAWPGRRDLFLIALAGALPDLVNPHLTLEARMTSWSHGLPCWLGITVILVAFSLMNRRRFRLTLASLMSAALLLHIACDAISGGVNLLYPLGDLRFARNWVGPLWWIPLDVLCIIICYLLFRILPGLAKLRAAKKSVTEN